jgi:hypothetical protein
MDDDVTEHKQAGTHLQFYHIRQLSCGANCRIYITPNVAMKWKSLELNTKYEMACLCEVGSYSKVK